MGFDQTALDSLRIERPPETKTANSRKPWRPIAIGAALVIVAVVGSAAVVSGSKPLEVEAATAMQVDGGSSAVVDGSGYVVARRQATVSSKVTGKIAAVFVEEGMSVKEGELLARLDETSVRPQYLLAVRQVEASAKNLDEARVRHAQAERDLARVEQLRAQKLVSESALESAQAEASAQFARLGALESNVTVAEQATKVRLQDLADLEVRSPFAGVIVSKDAQPGEIVSPTSAGGGFTRTGVATIVDMGSREIEVDMNEAFINRVYSQQKAEAVLDAYPDWRIHAHVINIVPTADRQKATVRVRIAFDELDPRILPNMGVKVHFLDDTASAPVASRSAVRVPATAIVRLEGKTYLWRVSDGAAQRVAVSASEQERNGTIETYAGVAAGDIVVTQPVPDLRDGIKVALKRNE